VIKILLITFFLIISIEARENPFFPSDGEKDIPYTTNQNKELQKLKRATISLPSYARVVKKITIEYESLDASIETKSIELNNAIDWHLPLFISQSYKQQNSFTPNSSKKEKKQKELYKLTGKIKYSKFFSF